MAVDPLATGRPSRTCSAPRAVPPPLTARAHWWQRSAQGKALHDHRRKVLALLATRGIPDAICFGSVALGVAGTDSDIDLYVDTAADPDTLIGLGEQLEQLLGFPVDISTRLTTGASVRAAIARNGRTLRRL